MTGYSHGGSLLQREQSVRESWSRSTGGTKTLKEVIDAASKEIEAVFVAQRGNISVTVKTP